MEKVSASINQVAGLLKSPSALYSSVAGPTAVDTSSEDEKSENEKPKNEKNVQHYPDIKITHAMPTTIKKYKAAAVTAEPGWFDLEASVQKTIHWINEAGKAGCKLVAFPEVCTSTDLIHLSIMVRDQPLTFPRDPWLSLLDVEDKLPRISSLFEVLPAELTPVRLRRDAPDSRRCSRECHLRLHGL